MDRATVAPIDLETLPLATGLISGLLCPAPARAFRISSSGSGRIGATSLISGALLRLVDRLRDVHRGRDDRLEERDGGVLVLHDPVDHHVEERTPHEVLPETGVLAETRLGGVGDAVGGENERPHGHVELDLGHAALGGHETGDGVSGRVLVEHLDDLVASQVEVGVVLDLLARSEHRLGLEVVLDHVGIPFRLEISLRDVDVGAQGPDGRVVDVGCGDEVDDERPDRRADGADGCSGPDGASDGRADGAADDGLDSEAQDLAHDEFLSLANGLKPPPLVDGGEAHSSSSSRMSSASDSMVSSVSSLESLFPSDISAPIASRVPQAATAYVAPFTASAAQAARSGCLAAYSSRRALIRARMEGFLSEEGGVASPLSAGTGVRSWLVLMVVFLSIERTGSHYEPCKICYSADLVPGRLRRVDEAQDGARLALVVEPSGDVDLDQRTEDPPAEQLAGVSGSESHLAEELVQRDGVAVRDLVVALVDRVLDEGPSRPEISPGEGLVPEDLDVRAILDDRTLPDDALGTALLDLLLDLLARLLGQGLDRLANIPQLGLRGAEGEGGGGETARADAIRRDDAPDGERPARDGPDVALPPGLDEIDEVLTAGVAALIADLLGLDVSASRLDGRGPDAGHRETREDPDGVPGDETCDRCDSDHGRSFLEDDETRGYTFSLWDL
nr:MAG TPA: hypothetical protein [Caudoviricetes sp.]